MYLNRLTGDLISVSPESSRKSEDSVGSTRHSEDSVGTGSRFSGFSLDERRFSGDRMAEKRKEVLPDPLQLPMESLNLQSTRQEPSAPIGSPPSWQNEKEPRAPRAAFKPQDFKIGKLLGLGSYSKVSSLERRLQGALQLVGDVNVAVQISVRVLHELNFGGMCSCSSREGAMWTCRYSDFFSEERYENVLTIYVDCQCCSSEWCNVINAKRLLQTSWWFSLDS